MADLINSRPCVLLTGIRQTGKSSLLQRILPDARYITFDDYLLADSAETNPKAFLSSLSEKQIILDEIQYVPGLFRELKILIDQDRRIPARWILTGSQKFVLMEAARESLAGRIGLIELETLSSEELSSDFPEKESKNLLWQGGFPELWANGNINISSYLGDYITTYLEKDLRSIINTPNLRDFNRFLRACAVRTGSLVNYTDMARDTGISPNTAKAWLNTLVRSGIITLLEPWFGNLSKRFTKSPKIFFNDQGILCHLLNITGFDQLESSPFSGAVWENFVFNELIRTSGISPAVNLFFYRDQNKVEVDFLIETGSRIILIEAKFAERPGKTKVPAVGDLLNADSSSRYCACRVPGKGLFPSRDGIVLYNPLLTGLVLHPA
ncbi:MAG: ATP-binding protein [Spirochaetales bacterium]|nr:ATP-binding protein [Spirochaetales bacterium]